MVAHDPPAEPHALVAGTGDVLEPAEAPEELDAEREDFTHIKALVDVRICSAIPLLEQEIGHCSVASARIDSFQYEHCVFDAMDKVNGHEGVLLRNLYAERLAPRYRNAAIRPKT